ncbi:MAG: RloB domain-containing protein [Saprospiraceae bacterium]|nr:RloB domain-containing protein [Bacteroidia bacterium]MBP7541223.1 RloB domain-containing protein [Saprospiraceae bacterium]MBP9179931.1 RloB domain-containing protein [Bacteroidia bacterium]MBP9724833.1 RloB domain-containing protein [Bacteroidia bacterium]
MAKRGSINKTEPKEKDKRPIRWRRYPHLFLIVCEDGKTEPYYFQTFEKAIPEETIFLRAVGTGRSSKGVVEQAILEREKLAEEANKKVDEVWVVFDKDDAEKAPANALRFIEAFKIAQEEKMKVAYSNEVFELWILLHFIDVSPEKAIPRAGIYSSLESAIKANKSHELFVYEHGKTAVIDALIELGSETLAIERAEKLYIEQKGKQPIDANPSTTAHILVKRLRELIEWYSDLPE